MDFRTQGCELPSAASVRHHRWSGSRTTCGRRGRVAEAVGCGPLFARRCGHNVVMAKTHEVQGIDHLPVYLISPDDPWEIAEEDFIDGLPLVDVLNRMATGDHLYFVDFSSVLGHTKLTRLV